MPETAIARFFPVANEGVALPPFDAGANAVRRIVIDLTAARSRQRLNIGGNFLWMADASLSSANLDIGFSQDNGDDYVPFKQGTVVKGVKFSSIYISNPAQAGVTATLIYVVEADQSMEVSNAGTTVSTFTSTKSTTLTSTADVSMLAASTTIIKAANSLRRRIVITNLAAGAQILRVGDINTGASRGVQVNPGETVTFETTAAIYGYNPGGVAQSVSVVEELD